MPRLKKGDWVIFTKKIPREHQYVVGHDRYKKLGEDIRPGARGLVGNSVGDFIWIEILYGNRYKAQSTNPPAAFWFNPSFEDQFSQGIIIRRELNKKFFGCFYFLVNEPTIEQIISLLLPRKRGVK